MATGKHSDDVEKADMLVVPWNTGPHVHERMIDKGRVNPASVSTGGYFGAVDLKPGHVYVLNGRDGKLYKILVRSVTKQTSTEGGMLQSTFRIQLSYEPL